MTGLILVVAEHRRGALNPASLETVAAALELKRTTSVDVAVAIIAKNPENFVEQVSKAGVDEVISVRLPVDDFQSDIYEAAVLAIAEVRKPRAILFPHTVDTWGYAPAVAVRGGFGCATDIIEVRFDSDGLVAVRAAYAEKVHVEVDFPGKRTVVVTIRTNVYKPAEAQGDPIVSVFDAPATRARTEHVSYIEPEQTGDIDISQAEYVLAIGRGVGDEENVEQFK